MAAGRGGWTPFHYSSGNPVRRKDGNGYQDENGLQDVFQYLPEGTEEVFSFLPAAEGPVSDSTPGRGTRTQPIGGAVQHEGTDIVIDRDEPLESPVARDAVEWAEDALESQDRRFFDKAPMARYHDEIVGLRTKVVYQGAFSKCNLFAAAAYEEGAGVQYPLVEGRPPTASELANPAAPLEGLEYMGALPEAELLLGDITVWYQPTEGVHHTALVIDVSPEGRATVAYAGAGQELKSRSYSYVSFGLIGNKGRAPVVRRWTGRSAYSAAGE